MDYHLSDRSDQWVMMMMMMMMLNAKTGTQLTKPND